MSAPSGCRKLPASCKCLCPAHCFQMCCPVAQCSQSSLYLCFPLFHHSLVATSVKPVPQSPILASAKLCARKPAHLLRASPINLQQTRSYGKISFETGKTPGGKKLISNHSREDCQGAGNGRVHHRGNPEAMVKTCVVIRHRQIYITSNLPL